MAKVPEARGLSILLLLLLATVAVGQQYKPAIEDQSGQVVDSVPLRYARMEFPAFGRFRPASGNPGNVRVGKSGNFIMSVVLDGQTISSMPFSLREENSTDP